MARDRKPDVYWEGEYYAPSELKHMELKQCSFCLEVKPLASYFKRNDGATPKICKSCAEDDYLPGLSIERYDSLIDKYGAACMICGTGSPGIRGRFCIDHDHETNKIRGLLCSNCNNGLGQFKDSIPVLMSAISYLRRGSK